MIRIGDKSFEKENLINSRTSVLAQSGSGKSYMLKVLCEELVKESINFLIIDTEDEYANLKNLGVKLTDLNENNFEKIAKELTKNSVSTVLNTFNTENESTLVEKFLKELVKNQYINQKQLILIIEEADRFTPQKLDEKNPIQEISKRGRKRNMGLIIVTQRPSIINKTVLSQCNNQIIGRIKLLNDLNSIKPFLENKEQVKKIPKLKVGEFLLLGDLEKGLVKVRSLEIPEHVKKEEITKEELGEEIEEKVIEEKAKKLPFNLKNKKYFLFGGSEKISKIKEKKLCLKLLTVSRIDKKSKLKKYLVHEQKLMNYEPLKILENFEDLKNLDYKEIKLLRNITEQKTDFTIIDLRTDYSKSTIRTKLEKFEKLKFIYKTKKEGVIQYFKCVVSSFKKLKNCKIELNGVSVKNPDFWTEYFKSFNEYEQVISTIKIELVIKIYETNHRFLLFNDLNKKQIKDKEIIKLIIPIQ